jgi:hypothetical protein
MITLAPTCEASALINFLALTSSDSSSSKQTSSSSSIKSMATYSDRQQAAFALLLDSNSTIPYPSNTPSSLSPFPSPPKAIIDDPPPQQSLPSVVSLGKDSHHCIFQLVFGLKFSQLISCVTQKPTKAAPSGGPLYLKPYQDVFVSSRPSAVRDLLAIYYNHHQSST